MSDTWYIRKDVNDPWFGPVSYKTARYQARTMTRDGTPYVVKFAQIGTELGARPGDPAGMPESGIVVVYQYVNGKQFLRGRAAQFSQQLYVNQEP